MNTAPLEVTTHIAAPPEKVWPYLTDPARYALWMGTEVTLSPTAGRPVPACTCATASRR